MTIMKKHTLILSLLVFSLAVAGCSKKTEDTVAATEVETTEEANAEEGTEENAEVDEDSLSGSIIAMDGDLITVMSDDSNKEIHFDISAAKVIKQFDLTEGDSVYVEYYVEEKDPLTATILEVEDSVLAKTMDPVVTGKVVETAESSITLEVDGENWIFATGNAYIVADNGITTGDDAVITYIGDLDDEPMAVKIVMADSTDSDAAKENAFIGEVAEIDEDNNCIVLMSDNEDFFTFITEDDLEGYSEGQTVQIFFNGSIASKNIEALKIVAK
jgi:hypothetical protein